MEYDKKSAVGSFLGLQNREIRKMRRVIQTAVGLKWHLSVILSETKCHANLIIVRLASTLTE
jgi:hypothetical protein